MPLPYTTNSHDDARAKERFDENLRAFFASENPRHEVDPEPVIDAITAAILAELDAIAVEDLATGQAQPVTTWSMISSGTTPRFADFIPTKEELDRLEAMKEPIVQTYQSPYDVAVLERHALEKRLETLSAQMEHLRPLLLKQLETVNAKVRLELERSTDDTWRERRGADEWRTENPDEYNASRRTKRAAPNTVTPKAILATETAEQKRTRLLARKAERKAASIAAETPEQAAERKAKEAARKAAKRAKLKAQSTSIEEA